MKLRRKMEEIKMTALKNENETDKKKWRSGVYLMERSMLSIRYLRK